MLRAISTVRAKVRDASVSSRFWVASLLTPHTNPSRRASSRYASNSQRVARRLSSATKSAMDSPTFCCRRWKWKRSAITRGFGSKCSSNTAMMSFSGFSFGQVGAIKSRNSLYVVRNFEHLFDYLFACACHYRYCVTESSVCQRNVCHVM